ncbi:MAG TPA: two-component regulator propeller domain-containing protein [Candidatus Manganitrophaceae bacterium]|nr:two-component regulator propeller domain-containing protein [Candidatus Manganitrophaceae bacterium]
MHRKIVSSFIFFFLLFFVLFFSNPAKPERGLASPPQRGKTSLSLSFNAHVRSLVTVMPPDFDPAVPDAAAQSPAEGLWSHFTLFSIVRSIAVEGETLWIGTSNGLLEYNQATEAQRVYTTKDGLLSNIIHTVAIDPKGNKWIGTYGGGLSKFDGKRWTTYTPYGSGSTLAYGKEWTPYPPGKGLGDLWVYGVHFDPKGEMWVATWKGVSRFDGKNFKTYTTDDGLIDKWVYTLAQDQKKTFWFGTEGGVTRFDGREWKSWSNKEGVGADVGRVRPPEAQELPFVPQHHSTGEKPLEYNPNYVVSSSIDAQNHLWIGTLGGGLSTFDGKAWKSYTKQDGLAGNMVHAIKIDSKGLIWIGTDGGVSRFDGKRFSNLTEKDGIGSVYAIEFDRQGNKWFGTFGGVSQYKGN